VEINDWDMIFRDRAGLLRDLEDTVQFLAQCRYIPADLVIGDLGVDLGRGDPFVPQHLADRFQRHALRKRDRRGKGMTRHMNRRVERQTGVSGNMPQGHVQRIISAFERKDPVA